MRPLVKGAGLFMIVYYIYSHKNLIVWLPCLVGASACGALALLASAG